MSEKAFALIGVIFFVTILNLLSLSVWLSARTARQRATTEAHSMAAANAANAESLLLALKEEPLESIFNAGSTARTGVVQVERKILGASNLRSIDLTAYPAVDGLRLPAGYLFPRIDYDNIFSSAAACGGTVTALRNPALPSGRQLTAGSIFAPDTCSARELPAAALILNSNLELEGAPAIENGMNEYLLAATGFLDVNARLEAAGSVLIISGGDLHIKELAAAAPAKVTLISGSGQVHVGRLSGAPLLRVLAARGFDLPSNAHFEPHDVLPPIKEKDILGFTFK